MKPTPRGLHQSQNDDWGAAWQVDKDRTAKGTKDILSFYRKKLGLK